ncbi:MAG: hypothetical protein Q7J47_00455 [Azoarcus sp.]|nr:hypothetical protein [Azoarcus sp.]
MFDELRLTHLLGGDVESAPARMSDRFSALTRPVLLVNSDTDEDRYWTGVSPSTRQAVFRYLPDGGSGGEGMGGGGMAGMGGMGGGGGGRPGGGGVRQGAEIAVQAVSPAFLDATLRDDDMATEWLTRNATKWVESVGRLEMH